MERPRKKVLLPILVLCLLISLGSAARTKSSVGRCIDFITHGREDIPLISSRMSGEILARFPEEISFVQLEQGIQIREIDHAAFAAIKLAAAAHPDHPGYDLPALIGAISDAAFEYRVELINSRSAHNDFKILNYRREVKRTFGILEAQLGSKMAPASGSVSSSGSFQFSAGTSLKGVPLTVGFSKGYSYTLHGPAFGTPMKTVAVDATHTAMLAVLSGEIVRETYDIYDPDADTTYHIDRVVIDSELIEPYHIRCSLGTPTYADHVRRNKTVTYTNRLVFEQQVERDPESLIG